MESLLHNCVIIVKTILDKIGIKIYCRTKHYQKMKEKKGIHNGKRCFIVGNGPSLTVSDLDKLAGEDCFACNRIYGLYDRTVWHPRYYCMQDVRVMDAILKSDGDFEKAAGNSEYVFLPYKARKKFHAFTEKNLIFFYKRYKSLYTKDGTYPEGFMPFSGEAASGFSDGLSITYGMMQLAVYMGYKEIYLIGVDHNYQMKNGIVDASKSYAEGIKPLDMAKLFPPNFFINEISFRDAKRYCEKHGIMIKNVTRGGKLEIFERAQLEDVL